MKKIFWLILSVVFFVLFGLVYFSSNSEQFDIYKADYYFKKNDTQSAIKFYERAFDGGYKDSKARYNYVNLIINSPLDADAQDRLVKFINIGIDDGAEYKAKSFLSDLRYEIHRLYPDNYIPQGTYNKNIIRWSKRPITYGYVNPETAPDYFISEIENAFSDWEIRLDKILKFKKDNNNPDIIIRFIDNKKEAMESEKYISALTKPVIKSDVLKNMTIDYYLKSPDGEYFTKNQVYNNALHEIGHAIGFMGHSDYRKSIMYMSADTDIVTNDLRKSLTKADINTMKLLYSIKPDITDSEEAKGEYTKYLVLGNEQEVISAKMKEAKTYIHKAPNLPSGYIDLADSYMSAGEYQKAEKCLKKALELAKDNDTICMINYNIALTDYFIGDYKNAKIHLEKSGELKKSEDALRLMAEIHSKSGSKKEAVDLYELLISRYPSNIEYVIALTNIYVRDKEYFKARKVLKEFVSKNPNEKNNPRLAPYGIIRMFL